MEKITLTGGTLMDNSHSHSHSNGHQLQHHHDPLMTPQPQTVNNNNNNNMKQVTLTHEQQIELSKLVLRPMTNGHNNNNSCPQHGHHSHSHGHTHSHHQSPQPRVQHSNWQTVQGVGGVGGGIQVPAAALSLMIPVDEILTKPPAEIMEALSTLLRLGQYEKWETLALVLIQREKDGIYYAAQDSNNAATMNDGSHSSHNGPPSKSTQIQTNKNNNNNNNNKNTWWLWIDANGHTLLHWAAKRGDDKRFVEFFMNHAPASVLQELLHTTSHDNTAMTPLHWACTEPGAQSLGILSLFMTSRADINVNWEATDASGCTPLLIAAQYGQVEVCAYLLQKGKVDLHAMDTSLDTALHWAAYKGSLPVCGLLWWYHEQRQQPQHQQQHNNSNSNNNINSGDLMAPDQYGQTPLHLAALRGHTSTVRWLLHRTAPNRRDKLDLIHHKDSNGRTPLDLAIHKHRPTVQAVLQDAQDQLAVFNMRERSQWEIWRRHATKLALQMTSLHAWKLWLGFSADVNNDEADEAPQFPYYYMWAHGLVHLFVWYPWVFCPLHNPAAGLLWDLPFWHLLNVMNLFVAIFTLHKTTFTNPGNLVVEDEASYQKLPKQHRKVVQYWRKLYEATLESYATTNDMQHAIQHQPLCHTCHIARPLRSKHCRVTRSCVLMFDHHCPFVGNTVGLYNYPYFYLFLASIAFIHVGFIFNLGLFLHRSPTIPWGWLLLGIFQALHVVPTGGMFVYHTQLSISNITTNEHMNLSKYDYFQEKTTNSSTGTTTRRFRNPWFRSYFRNLLDRLSPTEELYMMPKQYQQAQQQQQQQQQQQHQSNNNNINKEQDDEEKQQRQGLLSHYNDSTV